MASVVLQSLRSSALNKELQKDNRLEAWSPGIQASDAASAQELIKISVANGADLSAGGTHRVTIPKSGIITSCYVRIVMVGASNSGVADTRLYITKALGCAFVEEANLMSHSRKISGINTQQTMSLIEAMPSGRRELYKTMCGYELHGQLQPTNALADTLNLHSGLTTGQRDLVVYCPILLPCFMGDRRQALWSSFCETMEVELKIRKMSDLIAAATGASTVPTVKATMCFNTTSLDDRLYQQAVNSVFKLGKSVQSLCRDYQLIAYDTQAVTGLADNGTTRGEELEFTASSNASSLCRSILVVVYKQNNTPKAGGYDLNQAAVVARVRDAKTKTPASLTAVTDTEDILSVTFSASGRDIINSSAEDALMQYAQEPFAADSSRMGNHFVHRFALDPKDGKYSGGCSLSSLSAQHWKVKAFIKRRAPGNANADGVVGDYGAHYRMEIWAENYKVVSVSSSDGSVRTALSV